MEKELQVIIENREGINVVSSRVVADQLNKEHKRVMQDCREKLEDGVEFVQSSYLNSQNKEQPEYLITKDGFILLCMNYQGYNEFKRAYIKKFNEMEKELNKIEIPVINGKELETNLLNAKIAFAKTCFSTIKKLKDEDYKEQSLKKLLSLLLDRESSTSYKDVKLNIPIDINKEYYTAAEVGRIYNLAAPTIGRIANDNNLKVDKYGKWVNKTPYYSKGDSNVWNYHKSVLPEFERILKNHTYYKKTK